MEQLKHFSHPHPLKLVKADRIYDLNKVIYCNACELEFSEGLAYGCKNCAYFLHKHCTEIPTELANPMHPQHKLRLYANRPCFCNVCRTHWTGFTYVCKPCDFDIDINCSLIRRADKYKAISHDHQMEFHPRSTVCFCDACAETGEDASYQCLTCHFWIHQKCGELPRKLQHDYHRHPLYLENRIPEKYRSKPVFCHVCDMNVRVNYWSYLCRDCGYFYHLQCLKVRIPRVTPGEYAVKKEELNHDSPGSKTKINNLTQNVQQLSVDHKVMDELERELAKMVGLNDLKEQLRTWVIQVMMDFERQKRGITILTKLPPHLALLGNPGTGKTTVARLLGKMLYKFGILPSDKFIEVRRTDLVAEYVGQTGPKTKKKIDEAEGGILFVDEAYELTKTNTKNDFGSEVIGELMTAMDKEKLSIILAGYPDEIQHMFASCNPGFRRRMSKLFHFDNYSSKELAEILQLKLNTQGSRFNGFKLERTLTIEEVGELIERMTTKEQRNNMNAGLVDQMLNNAKENMDSRLYNSKYVNNDLLSTITKVDLKVSLKMLGKNRETGDKVPEKK